MPFSQGCLGIGTLKIGFLNCVISVISVVQEGTNFTISDSTGEPVSLESEIVRRVALAQWKYPR